MPLAILATLAVVLITASSVIVALATPGSLDLVSSGPPGHALVTWAAPDGPAWTAGVRPGDTLVDGRLAIAGTHGGRASAPLALATTPPPTAFLLAALGLALTALGLLVLIRRTDRVAGRTFWRMSVLVGAALGVLPAGYHGAWWALALTFVFLHLQAPAILETALVFPTPAAPPRPRHRALLWAPMLALMLLYPLCWWRPLPFFPPVVALAAALLAGYLLATGVRVALVLARSRSYNAQRRAQVGLVGLGIAGGFAPFVALTMLPLVVAGQPLVPADITILALFLLPASVGLAIARGEFLGITRLVQRRTLHALLSVGLLAVLALGAAAAANAVSRRWGWPGSATIAGTSMLVALLYVALRGALLPRAERLLLRDSYETPGTLLDLSADLAGAAPAELGPLVVTRLGAILDLSIAVLATPDHHWEHVHPRSAAPDATRQAMAQQARALLDAPPSGVTSEGRVGALPVLIAPIRDGPRAMAMLCLGPKRGGDRYTPQDRALLGALCRHLAVLFGNGRLRAELDAQLAASRRMATERQTLLDRVVSAEEDERRRIAALLHDEAIQLGSEAARQLDDLLALPHLPLDAHMRAAGVAGLAGELVAQLRHVAGDLYPPPLQTSGLAPAIEALLEDTERRGGPRCHLEIDPLLERGDIDPGGEAVLYRIVREAVGNTLRHARATTIRVGMARADTRVRLCVRDDGVGFVRESTAALLARDHLGLVLLEQRVRELDGALEIATAPGQGTAIAVTVPRYVLARDEAAS